MGDVLAWVETRDGMPRAAGLETASAARALAERLDGSAHAVLLGPAGTSAAADEVARLGVERIFVAEAPEFANYHADAAVRAVEALHADAGYSAIFFPASAQGKELAPRVAVRLDRGLATEITEFELSDGRLVVTRPQYAGKALARLAFSETPALCTLRPNVFRPETREASLRVETITVATEPTRQRVRELEMGERDALDVAEASTVVSGGRGLRDPSNWHLLEDLVVALGDGAGLGASRAVVDAGWRPHAEQVGQTGKTVSPNLYFAIGISGAIQHLAGMRTAKCIVAVNKDPEAPIFKLADYGVVGDLFQILPRLTEEIRSVRAAG